MNVKFALSAWQQYLEWQAENPKIWVKINELIKESARTPYTGTGKPEPLKHDFAGCWSRRITEEHRLVYRFSKEEIEIIRCRGHYQD
jgi:toxin YoeB